MKDDENERAIRAIVECSVRIFADTFAGRHIKTYHKAPQGEFVKAGNLIRSALTLCRVTDITSSSDYATSFYKMVDNITQCLFSFSRRVNMKSQPNIKYKKYPTIEGYNNYVDYWNYICNTRNGFHLVSDELNKYQNILAKSMAIVHRQCY